MPSSKKGGFEFDPTMARLIPLGGGSHAYVNTLAGKTVHVSVHAAAFGELLTDIATAPTVAKRSAEVADRAAAIAADEHVERWQFAARVLRGEVTAAAEVEPAEELS